MPPPFEPFSHDAVRLRVRRAAARHAVVFALVAGACIAFAPLAPLFVPALTVPAVSICGLLLVAHATWTVRCVSRLHRQLAYVDLSASGLVVRDACGRQMALPWRAVQHVNVVDDGVEVVAALPRGGRRRLLFGADWPRANVLTRRLVRYADAHGRSLCVDGVACSALSLSPLRPALSPASDADAV